jgi:DNA-binding MarR family transcriptional regulator
MKNGIDPDNVSFVILDISRLLRAEFERRVSEAGLGITPAEARVLSHLARCGLVRQHVLADRLGMARMSMTGFLDRLERADLIRRVSDPADRRAKTVSLTGNAQPLMQQLALIGDEVREKARYGLSDAEWEQFRHVAIAVRSNLVAERQRTREATE